MFAENSLEQSDRGPPFEVRLLDVLVFEFYGQVIDVDHVALDVECLRRADRLAPVVDVDKFDFRHHVWPRDDSLGASRGRRWNRRRNLVLLKYRQSRQAMANLQ